MVPYPDLNNTKRVERMTCHCFLRPIRRDLTSRNFRDGTPGHFRPVLCSSMGQNHTAFSFKRHFKCVEFHKKCTVFLCPSGWSLHTSSTSVSGVFAAPLSLAWQKRCCTHSSQKKVIINIVTTSYSSHWINVNDQCICFAAIFYPTARALSGYSEVTWHLAMKLFPPRSLWAGNVAKSMTLPLTDVYFDDIVLLVVFFAGYI